MNYLHGYQFFNFPPFLAGIWWLFLGLLAVWSLIWKGLALWRAARRTDKGWFVVLLLVNTLGILDIIYLYVITKNRKS